MRTGVIINSQWLYHQPAVVIGETAEQYIVSHGGVRPYRYWKSNGYRVGWSKILRRGDEPDRFILDKEPQ